MVRFTQKWNSRRGASVLLALLALLTAAMVAAVILSASVTAVKRVGSDRTEQQAALAAGSAARLLRRGLEASGCTITTSSTRVGDGAGVASAPVFTGTGPLGFVLEEAVSGAYFSASDLHTVEVIPDLWQGKTAVAPAQLRFTLERYDTEGGSPVENWPVSGQIVGEGERRIYLTGWVPTIEERVTQSSAELEDGTPVLTTTRIRTLRWSVDLSTKRRQS